MATPHLHIRTLPPPSTGPPLPPRRLGAFQPLQLPLTNVPPPQAAQQVVLQFSGRLRSPDTARVRLRTKAHTAKRAVVITSCNYRRVSFFRCQEETLRVLSLRREGKRWHCSTGWQNTNVDVSRFSEGQRRLQPGNNLNMVYFLPFKKEVSRLPPLDSSAFDAHTRRMLGLLLESTTKPKVCTGFGRVCESRDRESIIHFAQQWNVFRRRGRSTWRATIQFKSFIAGDAYAELGY